MDTDKIEARKKQARAWFEALRDQIVAAFEAIEDALPATAPLADRPAGRFTRTPWSPHRSQHGASPAAAVSLAKT